MLATEPTIWLATILTTDATILTVEATILCLRGD